jgi:hypothetical protein
VRRGFCRASPASGESQTNKLCRDGAKRKATLRWPFKSPPEREDVVGRSNEAFADVQAFYFLKLQLLFVVTATRSLWRMGAVLAIP